MDIEDGIKRHKDRSAAAAAAGWIIRRGEYIMRYKGGFTMEPCMAAVYYDSSVYLEGYLRTGAENGV